MSLCVCVSDKFGVGVEHMAQSLEHCLVHKPKCSINAYTSKASLTIFLLHSIVFVYCVALYAIEAIGFAFTAVQMYHKLSRRKERGGREKKKTKCG